ncbi:hypothetical protein BSKO_04435 [Bryopsis sp. KO-2023]|nr:hypothetical protein BSKO_04435 [Bryopsis sp. KO-2023]
MSPSCTSTAEREVVRGELLYFYRRTHKKKDELTGGDLGALQQACVEADALAHQVEKPRDQAICSEVFYDLTDVGAQRTLKLTSRGGKMTPAVLIEALKTRFVAEGREADEFDWKKSGSLAVGFFNPGLAVSCMLGPMTVEARVRTITQRHRTRVTGTVLKPKEVHEGVAEDDKNRQTDKNMETMFGVIRHAEEGVPFGELILNHDSFSQTVENIFTLAFLVKDRRVHMSTDESLGLMVTVKQRPPKRQGKSSEQVREASVRESTVQSILKFHHDTFRVMKTVVAREDCKMPNRRKVAEATSVCSQDEGPSRMLDLHQVDDSEESSEEGNADAPAGSLLDITHLTQQDRNKTPESSQRNSALSKRKRESLGDNETAKRRTRRSQRLTPVN